MRVAWSEPSSSPAPPPSEPVEPPPSAPAKKMAGKGGEPNRKPDNTNFKQQTLPAWTPTLTPISVVVCFAMIGIPFVIIGVFLLQASNSIVEYEIRYDNLAECKIAENNAAKTCTVRQRPRRRSARAALFPPRKQLLCTFFSLVLDGARARAGLTFGRAQVDFKVEDKMDGDVYVYYQLKNFYQNHRTYVKSRSDKQLLGDPDFELDDCLPRKTAKVRARARRRRPPLRRASARGENV